MASKKAARAPVVKIRTADPLQDYYRDRNGDLYSVARLVDDAKDLPVFDCPLAALELSSTPWEGENMFSLAFHVKKCLDADLNCPILLDWEGGIADGRHRIIMAIALGRRTVKARRFPWKVEPDRKASS